MRPSETGLTQRERQILMLIGRGESSKAIAQALGISVWTVGSHRKRICAKLGVHTTAELIVRSAAEGALGGLVARRVKDRSCKLRVDLPSPYGRVQLTISGRLRHAPGIVTVQIGNKTYYF